MAPATRRAALAAVALAACCNTALSADPLVKSTTCGLVQGAWAMLPNGQERVAEFLSIPYAQPPLGALRWKAPLPATCWSGIYNATQYRNFCVQPGGFGSEDCLDLHVHVPEAVANGSVTGVPVMAYIHGGGLTAGSGNFEVVNSLAAHTGRDEGGIIVVTLNYRLAIFGFLAVSELSEENGGTSGNYGIMDQQLALQWIQANIASFGGDPQRVTLNGQSSGGTSIFALLASPLSLGLFQGAIALSGSINVSMSLPQAHAQNAPLVPALGCTNATVTARLACLRNKSATDLAWAMPNSWNTPGMWGLEDLSPAGMSYAGLPVVDGVVLTHSFADALAVGLVDVPLIFGNMGQENDLGPDVDTHGYTQAQWQALLNQSVAGWHSANMGGAIYNAYESDALVDVEKAYCDFNTDYGLTCGSVAVAMGAKSAGGVYKSPLYLFVNQWAPSTPIPAGGRFFRYAYHTWDWSAACENWPSPGQWTPQAGDWELARYLQSLWYQFMAVGRLGTSTGWLPFDASISFPKEYATFVFAADGESQLMVNYKADTCGLLEGYGFDSRFWWCN